MSVIYMHDYKITHDFAMCHRSVTITAVSALAALAVFKSRYPHLSDSVVRVERLPED